MGIQKTINTNDATTTQQTNQKAADFNKRCVACVNSRLASRFGACANTRCNRKFAHDGSNLVILKKKKELWRKKHCRKCKRTWHRDENAAKNIFRVFAFSLLYDARPYPLGHTNVPKEETTKNQTKNHYSKKTKTQQKKFSDAFFDNQKKRIEQFKSNLSNSNRSKKMLFNLDEPTEEELYLHMDQLKKERQKQNQQQQEQHEQQTQPSKSIKKSSSRSTKSKSK